MDEYVENKCKNCIHCNICCIKEDFKDLVRAIHAKNHSNHFDISIECNECISLYFDKADNNQDDGIMLFKEVNNKGGNEYV